MSYCESCGKLKRGICRFCQPQEYIDMLHKAFDNVVKDVAVAEREACASICDEHADDPVYCGAAIRARGNHAP
jgi:hypothetical protein